VTPILRILFSLTALLVVGLSAITPAMSADAASGDAGVTLTRLIDAYDGVKSLSADFTQESRFAGFNTIKTFKGHLELTRPNRMRWDYRDGSNQQIYLNDHQVTVYSPKAKQAIVSQLTPASDRQIPLHLLADVTGIEKTYRVTSGMDAGELLLTPLESDPKAPQEIHLWVDATSGLIHRIRLLLPGGSRSDITFEHVDPRAQVTPDRYRFKTPKGVYVVHPKSLFPSR